MCKEDKILEFLYFIKEISVLHKCVIIFLTDYNKLIGKNNDYITDEFLEKFFNYRIDLHKVNSKEIIEIAANQGYENTNNTDFVSTLNNIDLKYKVIIDSLERYGVRSSSFTDKRSSEEKQRDKEVAIEAEIKNHNSFIETIQNPRHLQKIYRKFSFFQNIIDKHIGNKDFDKYIDKIDYQTQIILLSLLSVISPKDYATIEENGIDYYIAQLHDINNYSNDSILQSIVLKEWKTSVHYDMVQEKLHFIHYLLTMPNELDKSANGLTTVQEKYINQLDSNEKVVNTSIEAVLTELLNAKFTEKSKKNSYIKQAISLYEDEINLGSLIIFMLEPLVSSQIASDDNILAFYEAILNLKIDDIKICKNYFIEFAKKYLIEKLKDITYFVRAVFDYDGDISKINSTGYNLEADCCDLMIKNYFDAINKYYKLELKKSDNTIDNLTSIYNKIEMECENKGVSSYSDIICLSEKAKEAIKCIGYLIKIESYIETQDETVAQNDYSERLSSIIDSIKNSSVRNRTNYYDKCNMLLMDMIGHCERVSEEDLEKINVMIEEYYKKYEVPPIEFRKMYIEIKEKVSTRNTR